jgi:hypothetical protein
MERGPAAKGMTEPEARQAESWAAFIGRPDGWGLAVRPCGARPFDETTGGRGDTRDLTGMSWLGSGGQSTVPVPACGGRASRATRTAADRLRQGR